MRRSLLLLIAAYFLSPLICRAEEIKTVAEIIDSFFPDKTVDPTNYYDRRLRPNYGAKEPVKVTCSAYILDVFGIDQNKHEMTLQMYFRQKWLDPRLRYQPPVGVEYITLPPDYNDKIWIPDTFIVNERSNVKHDLTIPNVFLRIKPDGEITRSIRITVTATCPMSLRWFPFTKHLCSLEIESYGHTADEFFYEWKSGNPVGLSATVGTPEFSILGHRPDQLRVNLTMGSYSRLALEFLISRHSYRYLQDVYFPATILVIVAFISMTVGALHFRILLSLICMVTMIIFTSLLANEMPRVSYQTALDFYIFTCSSMIFSVVIVNFIMYHLLKSTVHLNNRMRLRHLNGGGSGGGDEAKEILDGEPTEEYHVIGRPSFDNPVKGLLYKMCMYSQYTMPCLFLICCTLYWMIVLIASDSISDYPNILLNEITE